MQGLFAYRIRTPHDHLPKAEIALHAYMHMGHGELSPVTSVGVRRRMFATSVS